MADKVLSDGEAEAEGLETMSFVYDEAKTADERRFIYYVEQQRGKVGHHIREEDFPTLASPTHDRFMTCPSSLYCFVARQEKLHELMRDSGARVVLTGLGGDEMLISNEDPDIELADLIYLYRPVELYRRLRLWSQATNMPYLKLLRDAAVLVLPRWLQARFSTRVQIPYWFDSDFVRKFSLRDRKLGMADPYGFRLPSGRDASIGVWSIIFAISRYDMAELEPVEVAHPYLDRRLVEFLIAIPLEQKLRPGESRSLLRRAMAGIMPDQIIRRRSKKGPEEALCRALAREWPRLRPLLSDAHICRRGYFDQKRLLEALERARYGAEPQTYSLLETISLELWLRSFENWRRESSAALAPELHKAMC